MLAFSRMALLMLFTVGAAQAAQLTVKTPQQTLAVVKKADGTRLIEFYQQVAFPADVNWRTALISDYASTKRFMRRQKHCVNRWSSLKPAGATLAMAIWRSPPG